MDHPSTRRQVLQAACIALGASALSNVVTAAEQSKIRACLSPGSIGVKASPRQVIQLAIKHRFDSVEANAVFLTDLSDDELARLQQEMASANLTFGAAGLPVDFRGEDAKFEADLERLRKLAAGLKRAGVDRVGTWISPAHADLTYEENFKRHVERLRKIAVVLKDNGQRFGLEYVGTPMSRRNRKHPFIHTMKQTRQLIGDIGTGNVGFILDSWHWWTARETQADLLSLKPEQIISVDLNDAPERLTIDEQIDGQRELPCATSVIPIATFVTALVNLGYDGPARAEPFNKPLNEMDDDAACAATIAALRKALASGK